VRHRSHFNHAVGGVEVLHPVEVSVERDRSTLRRLGQTASHAFQLVACTKFYRIGSRTFSLEVGRART
jgi:hypothetical protein